MTLWAVQVKSPVTHATSFFPTPTREDAVESAGRINDWIHHVRTTGTEVPDVVADITADVVEWPRTAGEHAYLLVAINRQMSEDEWGEV